jgi:hypothetical protein
MRTQEQHNALVDRLRGAIGNHDPLMISDTLWCMSRADPDFEQADDTRFCDIARCALDEATCIMTKNDKERGW